MTQFKTIEKPIDAIKKIARAKTKKAKEKVIYDTWNSDCDEFFIGIQIALDKNMKFDLLDVVPKIQDEDDGNEGTFSFLDFFNLANKIAKKELTKKEASDAIDNAALTCNITEWNLWYRKILTKTLDKEIPLDIIRKCLLELTKS